MASLEVHVAAWGAREGQPWAVGCLWKKLLRGSFWWCGVFVFFFFLGSTFGRTFNVTRMF